MCHSADNPELSQLVRAVQAGDLRAYGQLISRMQTLVYAVCRRVLGERESALDATQDTFLRVFWGISKLSDPAAAPGFIRRTAIRCAHDVRRRRRARLVPLPAADDIPVLDEQEETWSALQRTQLARALLTLSHDERRITELFYYGGQSVTRIAEAWAMSELAMRKRLQRIREKLRKEIEMSEQQHVRDESLPGDLSDRVVELLARPLLVALPQNPVAKVVSLVQAQFVDYHSIELPEVIDLTRARAQLQCDPVYVPRDKLFHVDADRILRYDLSLPLWLASEGRGVPQRWLSSGKVYRNETESTTHMSAFHQLELLWLDDSARLDAWAFLGRALAALDAVVPGAVQRISASEYPFCTRAWDLGVEWQGEYHELAGCGVYSPDVVRLLGGDPERHTAIGLGLGLERAAALHYGVPDIRLIDSMKV